MKRTLAILIACLVVWDPSAAQVAVIVHRSVPAKSADASAILDIYSMNTSEWADGTPIVVFTLRGDNDVVMTFYRFLGKRPLDLMKLWLRIQLSGEGRAPMSLGSEDELVAKVASTPGAIGFARADKVNGKVKTIALIEETANDQP